jgi:hypothetical protein
MLCNECGSNAMTRLIPVVQLPVVACHARLEASLENNAKQERHVSLRFCSLLEYIRPTISFPFFNANAALLTHIVALHVSHCISVIGSLVCYFELLNIVPSSLYSMFEIRNGKEAPNLN